MIASTASAVAVAVCCLLGVGLPSVTAATVSAVQVQLDEMGPPALTPDNTLVVTGNLRNVSGVAISDARVSLRVQTRTLDSREQVASWADADVRDAAGEPVGAPLNLQGTLAPGAEVAFRLTVDAADLGLPASRAGWGPRGVAVELSGDDGGGSIDRLGLARSYLIWYPGREFEPISLTTLVPLVGPAPDPATGYVDGAALQSQLAPGGRLDRVLAAAGDDGMSWALDPALVTSAVRAAEGTTDTAPADPTAADPDPVATTPPDTPAGDQTGGEPTATPDDTEPQIGREARRWLQRLGQAAGRDVMALPWADADEQALAGGGGRFPDLLALARRLGQQQLSSALRQVSGGEDADLIEGMSWPVDGAIDAATLSTLTDAGTETTVLSAATAPPTNNLFSTPSAHATVATDDGDADALLYDDALSDLLAADADQSPAVAAQRVLAETAAIVRELPGTPDRSLMMVAPRDWDPDPATVEAMMSALSAAPWVQQQQLGEALASEASDIDRQNPEMTAAQASAALPTEHLEQVRDLRRAARSVTSMLRRPQPVLTRLERSLAGLTSAAWRGSESALPAARDQMGAGITGISQGVRVVTGRDVNLFASQSQLPLTVVNDLDQPVSVLLQLRPSVPRVQLQRTVAVTVDAGTRRALRVPVQALANGQVVVDVSLTTTDGDALGPVLPVTVQVQTDWENWALIVVGSLAALLVVVGLVRTIRGGRRRQPLGPEDLDESALAGRDDVVNRW